MSIVNNYGSYGTSPVRNYSAQMSNLLGNSNLGSGFSPAQIYGGIGGMGSAALSPWVGGGMTGAEQAQYGGVISPESISASLENLVSALGNFIVQLVYSVVQRLTEGLSLGSGGMSAANVSNPVAGGQMSGTPLTESATAGNLLVTNDVAQNSGTGIINSFFNGLEGFNGFLGNCLSFGSNLYSSIGDIINNRSSIMNTVGSFIGGISSFFGLGS